MECYCGKEMQRCKFCDDQYICSRCWDDNLCEYCYKKCCEKCFCDIGTYTERYQIDECNICNKRLCDDCKHWYIQSKTNQETSYICRDCILSEADKIRNLDL